MNPGILRAGWEAPEGVQALCTLRTGGVSAAPWDSLNLGTHVGDDLKAVAENRRRVAAVLDLPREPAWLDQQHGVRVVDMDRSTDPGPADAAITREPGRVLAILVADCTPVLLAGEDGAVLAAAHAGWRGLAAGVLEEAVAAMRTEPRGICAWLGPAIGAEHFEVGAEVRDAFLVHSADAAAAFAPNPRGRWQCDLAWLAGARLAALGVRRVWNAGVCTYADRQRCFSYRRDGRTGRMAALLWRSPR